MKARVEKLLTRADVSINGPRPWDIHVHNDDLYQRIFTGGSLALGEAYVDGWWDCSGLVSLMSEGVGWSRAKEAMTVVSKPP